FSTTFTGMAHNNIDETIAVHVCHSHACLPPGVAAYAGLRGDVFELKVSFVQVQHVGSHVGREIDIVEAVVVDVAHGNAAAIIEILVGKHIGGRRFLDDVLKGNSGLVGREGCEQRNLLSMEAGHTQE